MNPVALGRLIVKFHEQEGLPHEISMMLAAQDKQRVALIGILSECARRNISKKLTLEMVRNWAEIFPDHTETEDKALKHLLENNK